MQPTIGRIVHCMTADGAVSPGIITKVHDEPGPTGTPVVNVYLFKDEPSAVPERAQGLYMLQGPSESETGTWWWPERV
jgi:hypothetical protein